jgi:hypothetical protein
VEGAADQRAFRSAADFNGRLREIMDDLDAILNGEDTSAPIEAEAAPQPETIGQPRDESGKFAPKSTGETQETVNAVPPTEEPQMVPIKAKQDEVRSKRPKRAFKPSKYRLHRFKRNLLRPRLPFGRMNRAHSSITAHKSSPRQLNRRNFVPLCECLK